jgi:uncharacterized membrane protein
LKHITATFLRGLVTILPIALTVYILWWLGSLAESVLGRPLKAFLPAWSYVPGLGIVVGAVLVFGVGLVMELYVARRLLAGVERLVLRIPVVKTVYGAIKDFADFLSSASKEQSAGQQVVRVQVAPSMFLLGFVTRQDLDGQPAAGGASDTIAVYLPMSYQIGGYTLLLPRAMVEPVSMSVEDALRFTLTAGMSHQGGSAQTLSLARH